MTTEPPGPANPAGPEADILVGDLYLTRTFRLAADGLLYPVFGTTPWAPGTLTATCKKGLTHTAPAPECTCGFYAYSDPAYLGEQPPWRHIAAVVALTGTVELSTRGARAQHARLQALWLGPRVTPALHAALAANYPGLPLYRDRDQMYAEHPLTGSPLFPAPRHDVATRARGRRALRAYTLATFIGGLIPSVIGLTSPAAAAVWVLLVLGAIAVVRVSKYDKSPTVALAGFLSLCWLIPTSSHTAGLFHTDALLAAITTITVWRYRARPGQTSPPLRQRWRPTT